MKNHLEKKHIGWLLKNINKKVVCRLNKELEAFDLTLMQREILGYIYCKGKEEDVFQKQIEEYCNSTNPTITGILKRLEAKGLIVRESSLVDARYKKLTLTSKAHEVIMQTDRLGPMKIETKITNKLSQEERDELERLLSMVLEALDE